MIRVDPSWRELLARLEGAPSWRSTFIVGPVDSGKTTLCRFLGAQLAQRSRTAAIDCDPGQSTLGPPACLSSAWEPWGGGRPLAMRFVGSTTPTGHLLQTLSGVKRLAEGAFEAGAQKALFDSSGYADMGALREFHFQTLDLLQPDHLVALQRADEMEPLLANFDRRAIPRIHRLPASEAVIRRSQAERRAHRQRKFERYFRTAQRQTLPLEGIGFHGMVPSSEAPSDYRDRLIALCGRRGFALALGIVEELDLGRAHLRLHAPPFEREQVASIQVGSIRLDRSGRER